MIVSLTGTLVDLDAQSATLDVLGVGYELGISYKTYESLPVVGETGITLLTRMIVKENAVELYGFSTRAERAVFDRLVAISGVGPKLALAILSTFSPESLANVVLLQDEQRLSTVPGVGKKKAQRLLVEMQDIFAKDVVLKELVGIADPEADVTPAKRDDKEQLKEAEAALLSMGFSPKECELALEGIEGADAMSVDKLLTEALRKLGGAL